MMSSTDPKIYTKKNGAQRKIFISCVYLLKSPHDYSECYYDKVRINQATNLCRITRFSLTGSGVSTSGCGLKQS